MAGSFTRQSDGGTISRMHHFKLVLLGDTSVGKSSLVLRFVKDQFRDSLESTVGGKLEISEFCVQGCKKYMCQFSLSVNCSH